MTDNIISSSDFLKLIESDDRKALDRLSVQLVDGMSLYLRTVHRANHETAEELAQQAFLNVYQRVKDGTVKDKNNLFGYFIATAKNEFFNHLRERRDDTNVPLKDDVKSESESFVKSLYDEERKKLLMSCIEKLDNQSRQFMFGVLRYIDDTEEVAADKMGITHNTFRTRKSRIIHILHECVQKKINNKKGLD